MPKNYFIRVIKNITEEEVDFFLKGNIINQKQRRLLLYRVTSMPSVWVGEASWTKAEIFNSIENFVPPIVAAAKNIFENRPVIDDEVIEKIEKAFNQPNKTEYKINAKKYVIKFLNKYKGYKAFFSVW